METAGDAAVGIPGPGEETCQAAPIQQVSHTWRKQYCQKMTRCKLINHYFYNLGEDNTMHAPELFISTKP